MKIINKLPAIEEINQDFFDSLKDDYLDFSIWYQKKVLKESRDCFTIYNGKTIVAMAILKEKDSKLKVATFKISPLYKNMLLGEILLKQIFFKALNNDFDKIYMDIFPERRQDLIEYLSKWGFKLENHKFNKKYNKNVAQLVKKFNPTTTQDKKEYFPQILSNQETKLITIEPEYHEILFFNPEIDIKENINLKNQPQKLSITKVYSTNDLHNFKRGQTVFVYKKNGPKEKGHITNIVTISEILKKGIDYKTLEEFNKLVKNKNGFLSDNDIPNWFKNKGLLIFKHHATFNAEKKILYYDVVSTNNYPHTELISKEKTAKLLKEFKLNENFIINA